MASLNIPLDTLSSSESYTYSPNKPKLVKGATAYDLTSGKFITDTGAFLNSNSIIAKIAFLCLVLFCFMILLRIATMVLKHAYNPSQSPYLVRNMKSAQVMQVIRQNPKERDAITLMRSRNENKGIEFTYSVWMMIDNLKYMRGQYRHVFHKGNDDINFDNKKNMGLNFPNNAPGLYIHPTKNTLVVIMNTFKTINEKIEVDNIPLNKWINVIIRVENKNVDIYINGNIAVRHKLSSVPKQNYGDVFVNMNGGYSGYLSKLRYYNHGLNISQIHNIIRKGPSLKSEETNLTNSFPPYLSLKWYFS
jgi:hypothetical protein